MLARLLRGTAANAFGQICNIVIQLAMVPALTASWGVERYGVWVLLSTIPTYLALGDFGFATAAGTDMTIAVARDDRDRAVDIFQSVILVIIAMATILLVVVGGLCLALPASLLQAHVTSGDDIRVAMLIMTAYGTSCLVSSLLLAGFRCDGLYANGVLAQWLTIVAEGCSSIAVASFGGSFRATAATLLAVRLLAFTLQLVWLRRRVPWLEIGLRRARTGEALRLLPPALAAVALSGAQASGLFGTALVLGAATTAATVAVFTTTRTLIRSGIQLTGLVNRALMPEYSAAIARSDSAQQQRMLAFTLATSLLVQVPAALILLFFGQRIVQVWTHGAITPPWPFLALMIAVMVVNSLWFPVSNLILATNKHASYAYPYLLLSLFCLGLSFPLALKWGVVGAAMSLLAVEIGMTVCIGRLALGNATMSGLFNGLSGSASGFGRLGGRLRRGKPLRDPPPVR